MEIIEVQSDIEMQVRAKGLQLLKQQISSPLLLCTEGQSLLWLHLSL